MSISIKNNNHIATVSKVGKREHNEDNFYPKPHEETKELSDEHLQQGLFIVCDGVGGESKGEVASEYVSKRFYELSQEKQATLFPENFTKEDYEAALQQLLKQVEQEMQEKIEESPESEGMSTTLTYLQLSKYGALVAWAGDSRVYQFRDEKIVKVTKDHSLVQQLIDQGELTEEQALSDPRRNMIVRAVSGTAYPTELEVELWTDVQEGDYFMLCTDGVLESYTDEELANLFDKKREADSLAHAIEATCEEKSSDNFTFTLFQTTGTPQAKVAVTTVAVPTTNIETNTTTNTEPKPSFLNRNKLGIFISILILGLVAALAWQINKKQILEQEEEREFQRKISMIQSKSLTDADAALILINDFITRESKHTYRDSLTKMKISYQDRVIQDSINHADLVVKVEAIENLILNNDCKEAHIKVDTLFQDNSETSKLQAIVNDVRRELKECGNAKNTALIANKRKRFRRANNQANELLKAKKYTDAVDLIDQERKGLLTSQRAKLNKLRDTALNSKCGEAIDLAVRYAKRDQKDKALIAINYEQQYPKYKDSHQERLSETRKDIEEDKIAVDKDPDLEPIKNPNLIDPSSSNKDTAMKIDISLDTGSHQVPKKDTLSPFKQLQERVNKADANTSYEVLKKLIDDILAYDLNKPDEKKFIEAKLPSLARKEITQLYNHVNSLTKKGYYHQDKRGEGGAIGNLNFYWDKRKKLLRKLKLKQEIEKKIKTLEKQAKNQYDHQVKAKETGRFLAEAYGRSLAEIKEANQDKNLEELKIGETVKIPKKK